MPEDKNQTNNSIKIVAEKIRGVENILVALSNNPSVDELAAAIGLTLILDKAGKHATAIYSGVTPNVLGFLDPTKTLEPNTNSLRDFIIALNKKKADHLRYKLEGDYVKVFITPYRTTLSEQDLEFSHGDFNVDLVLAMNVPTAEQLDRALVEYGKIMHDAVAVNIVAGEAVGVSSGVTGATGNAGATGAGKFGEVEWNNRQASSVSEMIVGLLEEMKEDLGVMEAEVATALLTGIVAATERFSNEKTTAETMMVAGRLMGYGADQKTIAEHMVRAGMKGKMIELGEEVEAGVVEARAVAEEKKVEKKEEDHTKLEINHNEGEMKADSEKVKLEEQAKIEEQVKELVLPEVEVANVGEEGQVNRGVEEKVELKTGEKVGELPALPEVKDYAKMMEEALAEPDPGTEKINLATQMAPTAPEVPEAGGVPALNYLKEEDPKPEADEGESEGYLKPAGKNIIEPLVKNEESKVILDGGAPGTSEIPMPMTPEMPGLPMPGGGLPMPGEMGVGMPMPMMPEVNFEEMMEGGMPVLPGVGGENLGIVGQSKMGSQGPNLNSKAVVKPEVESPKSPQSFKIPGM